MSDVALLLISLALSAAGLLAGWAAYKRSGAALALRVTAWSLVPMAAYLTGLTSWLAGLALNPLRWAGVVLAGLAGVLYVVSGVLLSRRPGRGERKAGSPGMSPGTSPASSPRRTATRREQRQGEITSGAGDSAVDPDLAEVEEILRRRGIS